MRRHVLIALVVLGTAISPFVSNAQEKMFSGPQAGEKLRPFKVKGVFDDLAGKDLDFVTQAGDKPILLVFVHDANRPSIAMTRILMDYAATRAKDGLVSGTIWLTEDATEAEGRLKTMRHGLSKDGVIGISLDGKEGPGAYGLNRNMTLTILIGKDGKVTANHALVQPSLESDLPRILKDLVAVVGGEVPDVRKLLEAKGMVKGKDEPDPKLVSLLRSLIQKTASEEDVARIGGEIEALIKSDEAARKEIARISFTIVNGGKVDNYGTPKAQEFLKKWARELEKDRPAATPKKDRERP